VTDVSSDSVKSNQNKLPALIQNISRQSNNTLSDNRSKTQVIPKSSVDLSTVQIAPMW